MLKLQEIKKQDILIKTCAPSVFFEGNTLDENTLNIDIIIEFIAKLNNNSKYLFDELDRIKKKTYEKNFHYYYYPILVELRI